MKVRLIKAPHKGFLGLLVGNMKTQDRSPIEGRKWGAVGLVQSSLIDLYQAADIAEKASPVSVALIQGSCPQHTQMLAVFGRQADVQAALSKIRDSIGT